MTWTRISPEDPKTLPPRYDTVVFIIKFADAKGLRAVGFWNGEGWKETAAGNYSREQVTHWQPLPALPGEESAPFAAGDRCPLCHDLGTLREPKAEHPADARVSIVQNWFLETLCNLRFWGTEPLPRAEEHDVTDLLERLDETMTGPAGSAQAESAQPVPSDAGGAVSGMPSASGHPIEHPASPDKVAIVRAWLGEDNPWEHVDRLLARLAEHDAASTPAELIERVAKAIYEAKFGTTRSWSDLSEEKQHDFERYARAAIEAIRPADWHETPTSPGWWFRSGVWFDLDAATVDAFKNARTQDAPVWGPVVVPEQEKKL